MVRLGVVGKLGGRGGGKNWEYGEEAMSGVSMSRGCHCTGWLKSGE